MKKWHNCKLILYAAFFYNMITVHVKKKRQQICMILDLPGVDQKTTAEFFCYSINAGDFRQIQFSFDDGDNGVPRVILKGNTEEVLELVNRYYQQ